MQSTRTIRVHRLTRAAFCSNTHLCTRTMVHACLHELYPRVFLEQEVMRVLSELNAVEIARIACARITIHAIFTQVQIKLYGICKSDVTVHNL